MHVSEKSFNVIRDRVTSDDIIGTKFLPLSEISGNGGAGMFQDTIFHLLSFIQAFIYDVVSLHPPELISVQLEFMHAVRDHLSEIFG